MKKYIFLILLSICLGFLSCSRMEINLEPKKEKASSIIQPYCVVDGVKPPLATRALMDQVTTVSMTANFLRIDEDVDASNTGLYTYTGGVSTPTTTVNWKRSYLIEGTVVSSPDNTPGIHYRSITLDPVQSYKTIVIDNSPNLNDTTHFYHTRMVGWYPRNCVLPRNAVGVAASTLFENNLFNAVREDDVLVGGRARTVLKFSGLDGSKDIMVSNVCEGQHWHRYNSATPHVSDRHPVTNANIYTAPFGHYTTGPEYSNYFKYKHYLSAVRIWAYADQSPQNLSMWGKISNVIIQNQPTTCKIWLPEEKDSEWGEAYEWGSPSNINILTTPMWGNDTNHATDNYSATYPISLTGANSLSNRVYLGYALIRPDNLLSVELHTTNGVYMIDISNFFKKPDDSIVEIFKSGYIYDVMLDLQTTGTIAVLLENESNEHFFDLTTLKEFNLEGQQVWSYRYANCYIVSPLDTRYRREYPVGSGSYEAYSGFCFSATTVGNGQAGILSNGSQKMYPLNAEINPAYAQILWETSLGLISDVELIYRYVRFKIPNPNKEGNAVIAVYDNNGKVLWSWHIWITDYPREQTFTSGTTTYTLLDRNIGATQAIWTNATDALETYGLYYQWGRKDPSPGPPTYNHSQINLLTAPFYDYSSEERRYIEVKQFAQPSLRDGVENPLYFILPAQQTLIYNFNWLYNNYNFLWGYNETTNTLVKTIYDPCPFGYRVTGGELNTFFTGSTPTLTTYGQTYSKNGNTFYFPYTGYKGIDRGLNSLVGEWKYVGRKADYQSALYGMTTGGNYLHRSRVYLSNTASWNEPGVGSYSSTVTLDYANRRVGAPVRCIKSEDFGILLADLNLPSVFGANEFLPIKCSARSSESVITSVKLERKYVLSSNSEDRTDLLFELTPGTSSWNTTYNYQVPDAATIATTTGVFTFVLTVINEAGVSTSRTVSSSFLKISIDYGNWLTVTNPLSAANNQPVVGQSSTLEIGVQSGVQISSVTIGGETATPSQLATEPGYSYASKYTVSNYVSSVSGRFNVPIVINLLDGRVATYNREVPVWGITRGEALTSVNYNNTGQYILSNTANSTTNVATNSAGSSIVASNVLDYGSLFKFSAASATTKLINVKTAKEVIGTTGAFSLGGTGTNYIIAAVSSGDFSIRTASGTKYYWKQTSATNIYLYTRTTNNYTWNIYNATFVEP